MRVTKHFTAILLLTRSINSMFQIQHILFVYLVIFVCYLDSLESKTYQLHGTSNKLNRCDSWFEKYGFNSIRKSVNNKKNYYLIINILLWHYSLLSIRTSQ